MSAASLSVPESARARSAVHPVLINGEWRASDSVGTLKATNPRTREVLGDVYPVSGWSDIDTALAAAATAAVELRATPDATSRIIAFLEGYASTIERRVDAIVAAAHAETGLAVSPRLKEVELVRTVNQLRQAATAAREGSWLRPTIDTKANLRSCLAPIGPVLVIGPNNFPFAYNGIAGGDFASSIAAGNPVIAKAHPLHPTASRLLAEAAHDAAVASELPRGTVQMLYHIEPADGLKLVADPRLKAVGFTGSRAGGLKLKAAADAAGKLFFGEMSSVNPVVILPGAITERADTIVDELSASVLMGTGQFCTKPGLVMLIAGAETEAFVQKTAAKFGATPAGVLFSESGQAALKSTIDELHAAGAQLLSGGAIAEGNAISVQNTLLRITGEQFLKNQSTFQKEAFGNASLLIVADSEKQLASIIESLEGNLTGSIYSARTNADDAIYDELAPLLRSRVGRFNNDKMPTGVAVSSAMNHGGPFPATSQPHFSAVGFPQAIFRFTQLESYDSVREHRLPPCLRDKNPTGKMWRMIDGEWTQKDL